MARFSLEVGFASDVGRLRQRNEDSFRVFLPLADEAKAVDLDCILIVADGMGGERAGDRASQLAVQRLEHWFSSGAYCSWPEYSGDEPLANALAKAVGDVSDEIYLVGQQNSEIKGLGSTIVIAAFRNDQATIAHVGDSRCYLIRDGNIEQLTTDHTWVRRQVDGGTMSADEARIHPQRNILTRSLGDPLAPAADVTTVDLRDNDLFVLCSDGLTGEVSGDEIRDAWVDELNRPTASGSSAKGDPQRLVERLIELANIKDGSDNVTVLAGRCFDSMVEHEETEDERAGEPVPESSNPSVDLDDTLVLPPTPVRFRRLLLPRLLGAAGAVALLVLGGLASFAWHHHRAANLLERGQALFAEGRVKEAEEALRELLELQLRAQEVDSFYRLVSKLAVTAEPSATAPSNALHIDAIPSAQRPDS